MNITFRFSGAFNFQKTLFFETKLKNILFRNGKWTNLIALQSSFRLNETIFPLCRSKEIFTIGGCELIILLIMENSLAFILNSKNKTFLFFRVILDGTKYLLKVEKNTDYIGKIGIFINEDNIDEETIEIKHAYKNLFI